MVITKQRMFTRLLTQLAEGRLTATDLTRYQTELDADEYNALVLMKQRLTSIVLQNNHLSQGWLEVHMAAEADDDELAHSYQQLATELRRSERVMVAIANGCLNELKDEPLLFSYALNQIINNYRHVLAQAEAIAVGNYAADITPRSDFDTIGVTLFNLSQTLQTVGKVCAAIAEGDLSQRIVVRNRHDKLANAVNKMASNLQNALQENEIANQKLRDSTQMLLQTEKMGALGTFAAGTAHELLNPLMGILNYVQYALNKIDAENKCYSLLQQAEQETQRCVGIIKNLLSYSRMDTSGEYTIINMRELMRTVLQLLDYRIKSAGASIQIMWAEKAEPIKGKINKLQQLLINLLLNALDAIAVSDEKKVCISEFYENQYLIISITDTGCGMNAEQLNKIFDPFYTTKPVGSGTGLGLPIVKGIVSEHNGEISCHSQAGVGTTMQLRLPLGDVIYDT